MGTHTLVWKGSKPMQGCSFFICSVSLGLSKSAIDSLCWQGGGVVRVWWCWLTLKTWHQLQKRHGECSVATVPTNGTVLKQEAKPEGRGNQKDHAQIAEWVKLAVKLDDLSLLLRIHIVEGENLPLRSCSLTSCMYTYMCMHACAHTHLSDLVYNTSMASLNFMSYC